MIIPFSKKDRKEQKSLLLFFPSITTLLKGSKKRAGFRKKKEMSYVCSKGEILTEGTDFFLLLKK